MKWKKIVSQRFVVCDREAIIWYTEHNQNRNILYTMLKALNHIKFTSANRKYNNNNNVEHR